MPHQIFHLRPPSSEWGAGGGPALMSRNPTPPLPPETQTSIRKICLQLPAPKPTLGPQDEIQQRLEN